jgi:hypothetical protein
MFAIANRMRTGLSIHVASEWADWLSRAESNVSNCTLRGLVAAPSGQRARQIPPYHLPETIQAGSVLVPNR